MTEDPYRWLEAIANRREYIRHQLLGGSPILAASLNAGILIVGVGTGQSKVFEVFDRQAFAGLGHPADLERIRQAVIDAAHLEAFTRAPEDVTLRRLVSHGLGPQLKTAFEQIFAPPFLLRLLLAELGASAREDYLIKVHYDGSFASNHRGIAVLTHDGEMETEAERRLSDVVRPDSNVPAAAAALLAEWIRLSAPENPPVSSNPTEPSLPADVRALIQPILQSGRTVEAALLDRSRTSSARYRPLSLDDMAGAPDGISSNAIP